MKTRSVCVVPIMVVIGTLSPALVMGQAREAAIVQSATSRESNIGPPPSDAPRAILRMPF